MNTLQNIIAVFALRGYRVFTRPLKLNIVGIRSESTSPNRFDDRICVFFKDQEGRWVFREYPATTDPGTYWLYNPMAPQGTAILAEGRYENAYQIGLHRSTYTALVQRGAPVTILRDYDRNAILDFNNGNAISGYFGINIHRANATGTTTVVDQHSAGCQVFSRKPDFDEFMLLCQGHSKLYGNAFTYTLIDNRAMQRAARRKAVFGAMAAGVAATALGATHFLASKGGEV